MFCYHTKDVTCSTCEAVRQSIFERIYGRGQYSEWVASQGTSEVILTVTDQTAEINKLKAELAATKHELDKALKECESYSDALVNQSDAIEFLLDESIKLEADYLEMVEERDALAASLAEVRSRVASLTIKNALKDLFIHAKLKAQALVVQAWGWSPLK